MIKNILKTISLLFISTFAVITFIVGCFTLSEGKNIIDPYIDTEFALKYSPESFDEIKIGMSVNEVIKIVGDPIFMTPRFINSSIITWYYTNDGRLMEAHSKNREIIGDDFAWYRSSIEIDSNEKVISIDKGWSFD